MIAAHDSKASWKWNECLFCGLSREIDVTSIEAVQKLEALMARAVA